MNGSPGAGEGHPLGAGEGGSLGTGGKSSKNIPLTMGDPDDEDEYHSAAEDTECPDSIHACPDREAGEGGVAEERVEQDKSAEQEEDVAKVELSEEQVRVCALVAQGLETYLRFVQPTC